MLQVNSSLVITLERKGDQLMPVDVRITMRNGKEETYHIPLSLMRGSKPEGSESYAFTALPAWQWTDPKYTFEVPGTIGDLERVLLDPAQKTADIDRENDAVVLPEGGGGLVKP